MKKLKTNLLVLSLLLSATAFSQEYGDFDANTDKKIDQNEFNQRFGENYNQWDTNMDDNVDEREFYEYTFNQLDQDRDRNLNQEEWMRGNDSLYGDYIGERDFNEIDSDRNQRVSNMEFEDALRRSYYYYDMDKNRDRKVDKNELNEGVYGRMDKNKDKSIDEQEYEAFDSFYSGDNIRPEVDR